MMDAMPPSSVKSTRLTAVRPPKRFVTPRASKRVNDLAGGPGMAPIVFSKGAMPPSYSPGPSLGRAPPGSPRGRQPAWLESAPRRASGSPQDDSSQLSLAPAGWQDALGPEDHHEHQDDAEDHPLVLRGLELRRQVGQVEPENRHAGVLELVEPEREALEDLEVQHGDRHGPEDRTRDRTHAAENDHGEHADRLQERERLRVDEELLG